MSALRWGCQCAVQELFISGREIVFSFDGRGAPHARGSDGLAIDAVGAVSGDEYA